MRRSVVLTVLCFALVTLGGIVSADTQARGPSTITLYGWIVGLDADLRVGDLEADVDASFSDILENLDAGIMLNYEYLKEDTADTGFYFDLIWADISTTTERPLLTIDSDVKMTLLEAGALLRAVSSQEGLDVIVGIRYVDFESEIGLTPPGVRESGDQSWLDPIVGVRYRTPLSDKWSFSGRGDIGGFGVGTEFSWQLIAVFKYQMSQRWCLDLGYRYLDMDYDESDFGFNGVMNGPLIGFAYGF